jgi:TRAP-type uncharacterized transport system substrate-binding protein
MKNGKISIGRLVSAVVAIFMASVIAIPSCLAEERKTYRVEMRGTNFGGIFYVLGFGAMDIVNKNSDWIRGSVVESSGSTENIKIVGKSPEKRSRNIFISTVAQQQEAEAGIAPFNDTPEKYEDVKAIMAVARMGVAMITTNPEITCFSDLKNKSFSTWPKGSAKYQDAYNYIGGVEDEVLKTINWQFTQYEGYEDLLVGKVDAAIGFFPMVAPGTFAPGLKLRELLTRSDKLRIIGATLEERKRAGKKFGTGYGVTGVLPANSVKEGIPEKNVLLSLGAGCWSAYPELPDDVVYEMLTQWKKNYEQFQKYHPMGKSLVPESWGLLPLSKEKWHPGAVKFFEANGLPYGEEVFEKEQVETLKKMGII